VFALGNMYEPRLILERLALSCMQELASTSGHTCALAIPSGTECMYVMAVENPSPAVIRVGVQPGRRRPYHTSAVGKILLANMPAEASDRLLAGMALAKLTPFTIDSVDALRAELAEIRKTGVAYSNQESVLGVGAVAAPVRNANGATLAAIAVVYPFHLVNRDARKRITRLTLEAATRISERVGWVTLASAYGRSMNV
jgi:DNA-binding IclR family transcriptional regulator